MFRRAKLWILCSWLALAPIPGRAQPPSIPGPVRSFPPDGGPPAANASFAPQRPPPSIRPVAGAELFEPAETVARVGDEYIFRGELAGEALLHMCLQLERLTPEQRRQAASAIQQQQEMLIRERLLASAVERKMMYLDYLQAIPPDKYEDALAQLETKIAETFSKQLLEMRDKLCETPADQHVDLMRQQAQLFRLAVIMKEVRLNSLRELDVFLRRYGSSLEIQQRIFGESELGRSHARSSIEFRPEITHAEMMAYYDQNREAFYVPARARWEQLTIRFDHVSSREEAWNQIAQLGNELVLGGTPFWAVAQRHSHGPQAEKGGFHDWTEWGDLNISRKINKAVFELQPMRLSEIIEDAEGVHIIRVLERTEAHYTPFREAQVSIKRDLQNKKRTAEYQKYMEQLRERTPVWTIYDRLAESR